MRIRDNLILDDEGRALILRGVNLGGGSKNPYGPPGSAFTAGSLSNPADVSFVGRPFPLEEAASHFGRLRRAGMTFLRFVVTWEALEHSGPGVYDEEYISYLEKIFLAAEESGISVFIDPHQDVWSRWTGGDGAPAWTMEKLGMDLNLIGSTGAAIVHKINISENPRPMGMMWPSNYNRYAAATMFTLFFAGAAFAPQLYIDGKNIQFWLQDHYIEAFRHLYRRVKHCRAVAGFGVINEPHMGFIGHNNLEKPENQVIPVGPRPSPWQTICAASGYTQKVPRYGLLSLGMFVSGYDTFNPGGVSLFREGFVCPWEQAGVWKKGERPELLVKDHFNKYQGRRPDFTEDFLKPFIIRFVNSMKEVDAGLLFFIEGTPHTRDTTVYPSWGESDPGNVVNAFHWYDAFSLFTKSFRKWFTVDPATAKIIIGQKNVQAYFSKCLRENADWTRLNMANIPCLLGEFGLAFDINKRSGFASGDYSTHEEALSMFYNAVDANLLHSTIWNYTADNTNEFGDGWNGEDLSIFSEGRERAAPGWKRPYPMATAGEPLEIAWDRKSGVFRYRFRAKALAEPTKIYLPEEFFGLSVQVDIVKNTESENNPVEKEIRHEYRPSEQLLLIHNGGYAGEAAITVRRK